MFWGVMFCLGLALVLTAVAPILGAYATPSLLAIVLGLTLGNTCYPRYAKRLDQGVQFTKKTLLRAAIVLYGLRLDATELYVAGLNALLLDSLMLISTFFLTLWLAKRFFNIDRDTAIMMGAGASICGAAAVLSTERLLKPEAHKSALALGTVTVFGTLSLLVYPSLYQLQILPLSPENFGIYLGAVVHEVAQVVAAGGVIGGAVADTAMVSKMTRVLLLVPFLLILGWYLGRERATEKATAAVPYFALGFLAVVALNAWLPQSALPVREVLIWLDNVMIVAAMVALGLTTSFKALWTLGVRPFALGLCVFLWLMLGGATLSWALL